MGFSRQFPMLAAIIAAIFFGLAISSCSHPKDKLAGGKIIPVKDGFNLPIANRPGSKTLKYNVGVGFDEQVAIIYSRRPLSEARMSFFYETDGKKEIKDCDFDFNCRKDSTYIYSLPYTWLIPKTIDKDIQKVLIVYVPSDIALPQTKETINNKEIITPDYTGYRFLFEKDEYQKYFSTFREHLR